MNTSAILKQHLIDPEICIRCNTCESICPVKAITHDSNNYVVDADTLVIRSAEGSKLLAATIGGKAAFEVDRWDAASGISVVAHGTLRELDDPDEIAYAAALPLRPWVGTIKAHFLCLTVTEITGRTFTFGDAPEDFAQLG